jgi:hypothetical protein
MIPLQENFRATPRIIPKIQNMEPKWINDFLLLFHSIDNDRRVSVLDSLAGVECL